MNRKSKFIRRLERVLGEDYVISHPDELFVYEYDGSIDRAFPSVVVFPNSVEQIVDLMRLANQYEVPVVTRGSGTGLSGGAIASSGGLQIALTRMNAILSIDVANKSAIVEPGVINLKLDEAARKHQLRYAPDPSSQSACTLGGNIAENAGGPHCLAYGTTTNHVLGMEVVLENGSKTWLGGRLRESKGYDLRGAFVGSEGTFGVATKIILRLLQSPPVTKTYLGVFSCVALACEAVSLIISEGLIPAAMEIVDSLTINAIQKTNDVGLPKDAGSVLLIELEGRIGEVEEQGEKVEELLKLVGVLEYRLASEKLEREVLWKTRKGALGALGNLAPNYYLVDGVVPRTRLVEILEKVNLIGEEHGIKIANVFHAGDGNIHPCILFDERKSGELERVIQVGGEILEACVALGGTLSGEHGIGLEKKAYMPLVFSPRDLELMLQVRKVFAPAGRLNPGKIFPDAIAYDYRQQREAVRNAGPGSYL